MKLIFIPVVLCALLSVAGARTFKNQKGQAIEGSLTAVDAVNAVITKGDGAKVTVPLKMLSAEDQKFCTEWRAANPEIKLTVKADSVTAAGSRKTGSGQSQEGSSTSSTSVTEKSRVSEEGYRITVSNWSKDPGTKVAGLTVRYAIVIGFYDSKAKDKRGVKNIVNGAADLPELTGSKPESVLTQTVKIGQSAAVATRTTKDSSGDSTTSQAAAVYRETVDGICFVVKQGEKVLSTYSTGRVPKELPGQLLK